MPLYALTVFLGAFLLFQVELILGKFILPWFGGSPGVWATCLVFFQTALFAGYAYAHGLVRLKPKTQAIVHGVLLSAAICCVPIVPDDAWKPSGAGDPTWAILALLTAVVGVPYFALAATAPLLQSWCGRTHPARSPYRLYAWSNAGSLLALVSYPFLVEGWLTRQAQAAVWAGGLLGFAALCAWCAVRVADAALSAPAPAPAAEPGAAPARGDWALWIALPAIASALLLAVTNKICEDLASMPFLWVPPLTLYLLSFILCFHSARWYLRAAFAALMTAGVGAVALLPVIDSEHLPLGVQLAVYCGTLFCGCMFCHGELYRLRPGPERLTGYYLAIAGGGAVGGLFVAVVAPRLFDSFAELPLSVWALTLFAAVLCWRTRSLALAFGSLAGAALCIVLAELLRVAPPARELLAAYWPAALLLSGSAVVAFGRPRGLVLRAWAPRAAAFPVVVTAGLGAAFCVVAHSGNEELVSASRNFFGVLRVFEEDRGDPKDDHFILLHGRIIHGLQFRNGPRAAMPTTYYGFTSGVGLAIESLPWDRPHRIGLVGLGTGTLTAYGRIGDTFRIYEIDPQVARIARTRFTYLAGCPARVRLVMGDARLSMERELAEGRPQGYDVLALDAFTSDAIPVHLLTLEAFRDYVAELRPDGILAVHVSNLYFDLQPVVEALARRLNLSCVCVSDDAGGPRNTEWWIYESQWMLLSRDPGVMRRPLIKAGADLTAAEVPGRAEPLWTDDYASLFKVLR